ncbi:MAG: hypothetical protein ACYTEQ_03790 [Planctomycetota bacterium]|jgi:hypothetical protein
MNSTPKNKIPKVLRAALVTVLMPACVVPAQFGADAAGVQVLADSVADWQDSVADDGLVSQAELGWEYGYISTFTGGGGVFYGWHQSPFYWESSTGIDISWPADGPPPDIVWGWGGDTTGCRPPMSWVDGAYPWAGGDTNKWAAVRRWTSDYTGLVKISGSIGRYFDTSVVIGWDVDFSVAINADMPGTPVIYTQHIAWNDTTLHPYLIDNVPIEAGDTIAFIINATSSNANNSYVKMTSTIATPEPCTLVLLGLGVLVVRIIRRTASFK